MSSPSQFTQATQSTTDLEDFIDTAFNSINQAEMEVDMEKGDSQEAKRNRLSLSKNRQVKLAAGPGRDADSQLVTSVSSTPRETSENKKRKFISPLTAAGSCEPSEGLSCSPGTVSLSALPDLSDMDCLSENAKDAVMTMMAEWMKNINLKVQKAVQEEVVYRIASMKVELLDYVESAVNTTDVLTSLESQHEEIEELHKENDVLVNKCKVLEGRLARVEHELDVLREEQLSQQARSMRDNVQFFNIPEQANENCKEVVMSFMKTEMKMPDNIISQIKFERIHRVGRYDRNQCRVIVGKTTSDGKKLLFQHAKNLKRPFGLSDQLPRELAERKRQLLPQYKEAKQQKKDVKWSVDKLVINGRVQRAAKDQVCDINLNTTERAMKMQPNLRHSQPIMKQGSTFQGHRVNVASRDDIIPALHAIYSDDRVGRASHNTYAYRLRSGGSVVEHYQDDGEWGAGGKLLALLRDNNIEDTLVCVSRWSDAPHVGRGKYSLILQAAKESLNE